MGKMITKLFVGTGLMWTHYLQTFTYAFKDLASPALNVLNPFHITYGRLPKVLLQI